MDILIDEDYTDMTVTTRKGMTEADMIDVAVTDSVLTKPDGIEMGSIVKVRELQKIKTFVRPQ